MGGKATRGSNPADQRSGRPDDSPPDAGPALGVLELSSIARGVVTADAAVKQAPSLLLLSRPVSGGKHLVVMRGPVAEIDESMRVGRAAAADLLVDSLELPFAADPLWPILNHAIAPGAGAEHFAHARGWGDDDEAEAAAIVETTTVCAALGAADAAAKCAPIVVRDVRLAVGIAGKAFFSMTGPLPDVEAAAAAASEFAGSRLIAVELIPAPAPELRGRLIF